MARYYYSTTTLLLLLLLGVHGQQQQRRLRKERLTPFPTISPTTRAPTVSPTMLPQLASAPPVASVKPPTMAPTALASSAPPSAASSSAWQWATASPTPAPTNRQSIVVSSQAPTGVALSSAPSAKPTWKLSLSPTSGVAPVENMPAPTDQPVPTPDNNEPVVQMYLLDFSLTLSPAMDQTVELTKSLETYLFQGLKATFAGLVAVDLVIMPNSRFLQPSRRFLQPSRRFLQEQQTLQYSGSATFPQESAPTQPQLEQEQTNLLNHDAALQQVVDSTLETRVVRVQLQSTNNDNNNNSMGLVIGIVVVGSIAVVALVVAPWLYWSRRRRNLSLEPTTSVIIPPVDDQVEEKAVAYTTKQQQQQQQGITRSYSGDSQEDSIAGFSMTSSQYGYLKPQMVWMGTATSTPNTADNTDYNSDSESQFTNTCQERPALPMLGRAPSYDTTDTEGPLDELIHDDDAPLDELIHDQKRSPTEQRSPTEHSLDHAILRSPTPQPDDDDPLVQAMIKPMLRDDDDDSDVDSQAPSDEMVADRQDQDLDDFVAVMEKAKNEARLPRSTSPPRVVAQLNTTTTTLNEEMILADYLRDRRQAKQDSRQQQS